MKVNWIKLDSAVCSATGLNKRKYLRNSSLRLLILCAIVSYDALIGHYLKRDRHKSKNEEVEKRVTWNCI